MNNKFQKSISIFLTLVIFSMICVTVSATETEQIQPNGIFIRKCIGYEPNHMSIDYDHTYVGFASGDNSQGTQPLTIEYTFSNSGSTTASIAGHANFSTEASVVIATVGRELGVELSVSRTWVQGTSSGCSYVVAPGTFQRVNAYIPAAVTTGRLKYEVYMDSNPENIFYEYKNLNSSSAPIKDSVHFKVVSVS